MQTKSFPSWLSHSTSSFQTLPKQQAKRLLSATIWLNVNYIPCTYKIKFMPYQRKQNHAKHCNSRISWEWWHIPVILSIKQLKQNEYEIEASLHYTRSSKTSSKFIWKDPVSKHMTEHLTIPQQTQVFPRLWIHNKPTSSSTWSWLVFSSLVLWDAISMAFEKKQKIIFLYPHPRKDTFSIL